MKGTKDSLGKFHWRTLFIGSMHFQDLYNYDIERIKRCVIHYTTPDHRIIPFCSYNTGPEYRKEVESKFGVPMGEWLKKNPGIHPMGLDLYPDAEVMPKNYKYPQKIEELYEKWGVPYNLKS